MREEVEMGGDEAEPQAVVFVSDRNGAALRRRERCLKLAAIGHQVEAERRPSGTYYKLCVQEKDAVAAHLALQMGGCGRSLKLRDQRPGTFEALREFGRTVWDEVRHLMSCLVDFARRVSPRLLPGPRESVAEK